MTLNRFLKGTAFSALAAAMTLTALPAAAAQVHRASLDAFVSLALDYSAQHPEGTVRTFLDWVTVLESKDALANPESEPDPTAVTVMTIHSSKGLEFDDVFFLDSDLVGNSQQEKNLRYVIITRSKSTLTYITTEGFNDEAEERIEENA